MVETCMSPTPCILRASHFRALDFSCCSLHQTYEMTLATLHCKLTGLLNECVIDYVNSAADPGGGKYAKGEIGSGLQAHAMAHLTKQLSIQL